MGNGREHGRDAQQQTGKQAGIQPGGQAAAEAKPVSAEKLTAREAGRRAADAAIASTLSVGPVMGPTFGELNARQQQFVRHYMSGASGREAALAAGYSPAAASRGAHRLLHEVPAVAKAIAEAKNLLAERSAYDADKALQELNQVLAFAERTNNATAAARAVELKMKLCGLMVDRAEVNINGSLDVTGAIANGRRRAGITFEAEAEDAELVEDEPGETPIDGQAEPIADFRNLHHLLS